LKDKKSGLSARFFYVEFVDLTANNAIILLITHHSSLITHHSSPITLF